MKKIVINKCYGGFSLSALAIARYVELTGRTAYFFDSTGGFGAKRAYTPMTVEDATKRGFFYAFDIPNPTPKDEDKHFISGYSFERNDPKLVQVVEELGEKANGSHAALRIVEIPDDVQYTIEEYDGIEHIAEEHQTWNHRGTSGQRRAAKALHIVAGRKFR